jgi:hypothetical protein
MFNHYERTFDCPSVIVYSHKQLHIYYHILNQCSNISFLKYIDNTSFDFKYAGNTFTFSHINDKNILQSYQYNAQKTVPYNGFSFNVTPLESVIAYCISNYSVLNNLQYLLDAAVLITIYYAEISTNLIFSSLLQVNVNVKKILKKAITQIKLLNFDKLVGFTFGSDLYINRTHEILGYCYEQ